MEKIISFGYGDAIGKFKRGTNEINEKTSLYVYVVFFAPSYADENVYIPAESIRITLDKRRMIEMRDLLNEFIRGMET